MAYREFTDLAGTDWIAFDVRPRKDDRRSQDRRSLTDASTDTADRSDQRREDRRLTVSVKGAVRFTKGWVCFESLDERRRLQPIPRHWDRLPDEALARLLESAPIAPVREVVTRTPKLRRD